MFFGVFFPTSILLPSGLKQHDLDSKTCKLSFSFPSAGSIWFWASVTMYSFKVAPAWTTWAFPKKRETASIRWQNHRQYCYNSYVCLATEACISYIKNSLKQFLLKGSTNFQRRKNTRSTLSYNPTSCGHPTTNAWCRRPEHQLDHNIIPAAHKLPFP